jgi:hypothetical protein
VAAAATVASEGVTNYLRKTPASAGVFFANRQWNLGRAGFEPAKA